MSDDFFNLNGEPVNKNTDAPSNQTPPDQQNSYNQNPYSQNPYGNGQNSYNYGQNSQNPYGGYNPNPNMGRPQKQGPNGLAITAFVLSLLSPILCCCGTYGMIVSLVACIASIILAFVSKQKKPFHGLAIAALIISFLYAAILIFMIICVVIVFNNPELTEIYYEMYEEMYQDIMYGEDFSVDLFRMLKF